MYMYMYMYIYIHNILCWWINMLHRKRTPWPILFWCLGSKSMTHYWGLENIGSMVWTMPRTKIEGRLGSMQKLANIWAPSILFPTCMQSHRSTRLCGHLLGKSFVFLPGPLASGVSLREGPVLFKPYGHKQKVPLPEPFFNHRAIMASYGYVFNITQKRLVIHTSWHQAWI